MLPGLLVEYGEAALESPGSDGGTRRDSSLFHLLPFLTPGFYLLPTAAYLPSFRRQLGTRTLQAESQLQILALASLATLGHSVPASWVCSVLGCINRKQELQEFAL